ncbi:MAG TPA: hypothetical protein VLA19_33080 [Herpetosiphonaceae bacterium]|nr:hypothetical protein [Herpetosiphonaceae bacterium]
MQRGLEATASLWPEIREANMWVRRAAHILANDEHVDGAGVQSSYQEVLVGMRNLQARDGWLGSVATTFLKVTANYGEGLFQGYDVPDLPATKNDLERRFGMLRFHERRCSGRRAVSGGVVLRGAVRVIAVLHAERIEVSAEKLRLKDHEVWRKLRQQLERRAETRRAQRRFRRDPVAYLSKLEQQLLN